MAGLGCVAVVVNLALRYGVQQCMIIFSVVEFSVRQQRPCSCVDLEAMLGCDISQRTERMLRNGFGWVRILVFCEGC